MQHSCRSANRSGPSWGRPAADSRCAAKGIRRLPAVTRPGGAISRSATALLRAVAIASVPLLAAAAAAAATEATEKVPRPNIVIILADDMGFSDLGCFGGEIATPHLDRLAANGLRLTQFYNTARCCPTRAALLTGLYPHQAGIGHMTGDFGYPAYRGRLNRHCMTIAELLRTVGYRTLCVGKWHVGSDPQYWPRQRGFERYFGTPTGGGAYFKEAFQFRKRFVVLDDERVEYPDGAYVTDLFTDYAVRFVEAAAGDDRPFFLYLAHIAPHWPLQARPEDIARYSGRYDVGWDHIRDRRYRRQLEMGLIDRRWPLSPRHPQAKPWKALPESKRRDLAHRMAVYAAQVDRLDRSVGRVVECLRDHGALEDTLIVFLSDNGCSAEGGPGGFRRGDPDAPIGSPRSYASVGLEWANASDTPFRRFKMNTHEGGIATPFIAHWPNGIAARGTIAHHVGHVIDLMPTCAELAGARYPSQHDGVELYPLEGRSLVPVFRDPSRPVESRTLYWEHQGNRAIREGNWKLVADHKGPWELYDLRADRTEVHDVAAEHPDVVRRLARKWQDWADRVGVRPWPVRRSKGR